MSYLWHLAVLVAIYSLLASSLNLVTGFGGLVSLCHAVFYGLGAYTTALLMVHAGWSFPLSMASGILIAVAISLLLSAPVSRLKGDYFILSTLGLQVIAVSVLENWTSFTGGSYGVTGIPRPIVFGHGLDSVPAYCLFAGAVATVGLSLLALLMRAPFGRVLRAMRDDEVAIAALGRNTPVLKITVFAIGAAFAALAGALFACYMQFIDPTSFGLMESILILSMVVIGGAGSPAGAVVGAFILVLLPEALRFAQIPDAVAANLRQVIYGVLLVVMMLCRPRGLQGEYGFD